MALETKSIFGLEIFGCGKFNGDRYTEQDLDNMVSAFNRVGFQPTIKAGHQNGQEDEQTARQLFGAPALGYVKRIWRSGKKLLADVGDIPARFADLIKAGSYKRVSAEIYWSYKQNGKTYPHVLKAVSFFGADIPALTSLAAIESLFQRTPTGAVYAYAGGQEFRIYDSHDYHDTLGDFLSMTPRLEKTQAGYRMSDGTDSCLSRRFFLGHWSACTIVEGFIEGRGTSDHYEAALEI